MRCELCGRTAKGHCGERQPAARNANGRTALTSLHVTVVPVKLRRMTRDRRTVSTEARPRGGGSHGSYGRGGESGETPCRPRGQKSEVPDSEAGPVGTLVLGHVKTGHGLASRITRVRTEHVHTRSQRPPRESRGVPLFLVPLPTRLFPRLLSPPPGPRRDPLHRLLRPVAGRRRSLAAAARPRHRASSPLRLAAPPPARPLHRPGRLRHRQREREGDQVWAAAAWQREVQPRHLLAQELHVLHDALPRKGGRLGAGASRSSRALSRLYLGEKAGA